MTQLANIQELKTAVDRYGEIVVIKNEENNFVIMSMEEYIRKAMKSDIIKNLKMSEEEIEKGEGIDSDTAFEELRQKYGY